MQQLGRHSRLFIDLFQHEMRVATFPGDLHAFNYVHRIALDLAAVCHAEQLDVIRVEGHNLSIVQTHDFTGQRQDRRQVGGHQGGVFSDPGHQPRAFLEAVQAILAHSPDDKGVIALQIFIGTADRVDHRVAAVKVALDRMDTELAVVLGAHEHTLSHEGLAQGHVVDHIAVMSPHQVAVRVQMGLGIDLGGHPECRPAQLQDAALSRHFVKTQPLGDLIHRTDILAQIDSLIGLDRGAADRVVAPVRQPAPGFNQDWAERTFFPGDDTEYSTQKRISCLLREIGVALQ